jgi:hypothetical protein
MELSVTKKKRRCRHGGGYLKKSKIKNIKYLQYTLQNEEV